MIGYWIYILTHLFSGQKKKKEKKDVYSGPEC